MVRYDITLDGKIKLDTYEEIAVSLNKEIEDILNIGTNTTDWTKSIKLPGTAINNKAFKQLFDVNIDLSTLDEFKPTKAIPANITVGDNEIFSGHLQVIDITVEHDLVEYTVTIFGTLSNFMDALENKTLADIDLSDFNHTRDQETIISSWEYGIYKNTSFKQNYEGGEGYVYPYIIYDNLQINNVFIYDLYPAVYLKTIMERIFEETGFKIKSKFFNSDYFKKLIVPFNGEKLEIDTSQFNARSIVIGTDAEFTNASPVTSQGSTWWNSNGNLLGWTRESGTVDDSTGELTFKDESGQFGVNTGFTCQNTGYYRVEFDGKLLAKYEHSSGNVRYDTGSGSFEYAYYLEVVKPNGAVTVIASSIDPNTGSPTLLFSPSDGLSHSSPWIDTATPLTTAMTVSNILLQAGERVRARYQFRYPQGVNWVGLGAESTTAQLVWDQVDANNSFSKFIVEPSSNNSMGNDLVNMNQVLPRTTKQKDFVGDVFKMFNLIAVGDKIDPRALIIEPKDDYFKSKQKVLDWEGEEKLDYDSGYKITPMSELDFGSYRYTYTEDSDYYNTLYTEETNKVYGDLVVDVENDFSEKENSTKLGISPTPVTSQYIGGKVAPMFVKKDDENFSPMKTKLRILFYGGLVGGGQLILQDFPGQAPADSYATYFFPYAGMWDNPFNPSYDLGFDATDKVYWNPTQYPNFNLFQKFHRNTLENIIDPNSKLLEGQFYLTPKDLAEFDFRDEVFLLGQYWRVNTIKDYNPTVNGLTTVILYKIKKNNPVPPKLTEIPVTNKSCPTDLVLRRSGKRWVYQSESGQPVTYDCCLSKGGEFKEGICFIGERNVVDTPFSAGVPTQGGGIPATNGNTVNSTGVKVRGKGNFVGEGIDSTVMITGRNNGVWDQTLRNVFVLGNDVRNIKSNTININGTVYGEQGVVIGYNLLRNSVDSVRNLFPQNPAISKWKSGTNAVRDPDFSSIINLIQSGRDYV